MNDDASHSLTTTTTYRAAYWGRPSSVADGDGRELDEANVRFEMLLTDRPRAAVATVPPLIAIRLLADRGTSTYARDFAPSFVSATDRPARERSPKRTGCSRMTTIDTFGKSPRTNVKYSGAAPPEPSVELRSEYWWSYGQLAERLIADRVHPKRTKRCRQNCER